MRLGCVLNEPSLEDDSDDEKKSPFLFWHGTFLGESSPNGFCMEASIFSLGCTDANSIVAKNTAD